MTTQQGNEYLLELLDYLKSDNCEKIREILKTPIGENKEFNITSQELRFIFNFGDVLGL